MSRNHHGLQTFTKTGNIAILNGVWEVVIMGDVNMPSLYWVTFYEYYLAVVLNVIIL